MVLTVDDRSGCLINRSVWPHTILLRSPALHRINQSLPLRSPPEKVKARRDPPVLILGKYPVTANLGGRSSQLTMRSASCNKPCSALQRGAAPAEQLLQASRNQAVARPASATPISTVP